MGFLGESQHPHIGHLSARPEISTLFKAFMSKEVWFFFLVKKSLKKRRGSNVLIASMRLNYRKLPLLRL